MEEFDTVEELFIAQNQLKVVDNGFTNIGLDSPEWVTDKLLSVESEINLRVKSEIQRKLKTAKARRSALASRSERKKTLDAEIKELESKLD
jgi:hypothetical protein